MKKKKQYLVLSALAATTIAQFLILPLIAFAQKEPLYIDPVFLETYYTQPVETITTDPAVTDPATTTDPATDPNGTLTTDPPTAEPPQDPTTTTTETSDQPATTTTNQYNPDGTTNSTLSIPPTIPSITYTPRTPTETPTDPRTPEQPLEEPSDDPQLECPEYQFYNPENFRPICPDPSQIIAESQPRIGNNQMIFSIIVMFGAGIGGLVWLLTSLFMQKTQLAREVRRSDRLLHQAASARINQQLESSWPKISNSIGDIIATLEQGKSPSTSQIQNLKQSTSSLDLFASKKTIAAKNHLIQNLVDHTPTETTIKSLAHLQSTLSTDLWR